MANEDEYKKIKTRYHSAGHGHHGTFCPGGVFCPDGILSEVITSGGGALCQFPGLPDVGTARSFRRHRCVTEERGR